MEGGELQSAIVQDVLYARGGDSQAFCRLIRQFEKPALATAFSVIGDASAAGDVVQDAFLNAWKHLSELREPNRFGPWLMQMVRNRAIDRTRVRVVAAFDPDIDAPAASESPGDAMEAAEMQSKIDRALRQLDETTRHVVAMRYFENLSSKEIAGRLDLSPAAIDMRLSRARQQLRELLSDFSVNER